MSSNSKGAHVDMAKASADMLIKLSEELQEQEKMAAQYKAAFDMAVEKLAAYEHLEDCRNLASEMLKKGYIAPEDLGDQVDKLKKMKLAELQGIRNTVRVMSAPHTSWGALDANVNVGEEAMSKSSSDYLEDLVMSLGDRR